MSVGFPRAVVGSPERGALGGDNRGRLAKPPYQLRLRVERIHLTKLAKGDGRGAPAKLECGEIGYQLSSVGPACVTVCCQRVRTVLDFPLCVVCGTKKSMTVFCLLNLVLIIGK